MKKLYLWKMSKEIEKMVEERGFDESGFDWKIHYVIPEKGDEPLTNVHTHGMDKHGSPDFQIVVPFQSDIVGHFLNAIGSIVAIGETIDEETEIYGFFSTGPVRFARFLETGRDVLRAICPDEKGKYPWDDGCQYPYSEQLRPAFAK